ncbi:hypothetical protein SK571_43565 [Lentzea sp. BCCO 10_0798]|uniref:Uncharacterized protein n=1 Tax=Lentzea kristufekii TaxID=3095430 RepID=A0ABU4U8K8_9PSEU|nr:hypothetical protein [Lentzea sp. BCCO 10_0798]MDX8056296.1 hypothetical protein [Lentzea sp. BCCO 10_0798]
MTRTPIFDELYAKYVGTPARDAMAPQWPGETDEVRPVVGNAAAGSPEPAGPPSHRRPM